MTKRKRKPGPKPKHPRSSVTGFSAIHALYRSIKRRVYPASFPSTTLWEQRGAAMRKVSKVFARELRARKLLAEEGYAPGSWAAEP